MGRGEPCEPKWLRQGTAPLNGPLTAWGVGALDRYDAKKTALVEGLRLAPWERGKDWPACSSASARSWSGGSTQGSRWHSLPETTSGGPPGS